MSQLEKLRATILAGTSDTNIDFPTLRKLLKRLGFAERVRGSHPIFSHKDMEEILSLQPQSGKARPYQVKQVRQVLVKYRLGDADVD